MSKKEEKKSTATRNICIHLLCTQRHSSALCRCVGKRNSGLAGTLTGRAWRKKMLLLLSLPCLLMHRRPGIYCFLLKKSPSIASPNSGARQTNEQYQFFHKGQKQHQIESSSCITEATIMGTASVKECLYVV